VTVPTEFLPGSRAGTLYRDGPDGLRAESVTVTPGEGVAVEVPEHGGIALHLQDSD
jgi:hypothetical protein